MTTCSRASFSQRHSSKPSVTSPHPLLAYMEHHKIHIVWILYITDTKSNLGYSAESPSWSTNCSLLYAHLNVILLWGDCSHTLSVLPLIPRIKHREEIVCRYSRWLYSTFVGFCFLTNGQNYWNNIYYLIDIKVKPLRCFSMQPSPTSATIQHGFMSYQYLATLILVFF